MTDGQEERIVRDDVPFQNPAEWAARFARCRVTVARIEPQPLSQSDEGFGTGFLIGPDLLLTNYHVIDSGVFVPEKVVVRFDCEYGTDARETVGRTCKLAADWKVASSVGVADGGLDFARPFCGWPRRRPAISHRRPSGGGSGWRHACSERVSHCSSSSTRPLARYSWPSAR